MRYSEFVKSADSAPSMFEDDLVRGWHDHMRYVRWIEHLINLDMVRWDSKRREYWTDMKHDDDFSIDRDVIWLIMAANRNPKARALIKHEDSNEPQS